MYAPNDHKKAPIFFQKTFMQIESLKEKLEDTGIHEVNIVTVGDFNFVHESKDRTSHVMNNMERALATSVTEQIENLNLKDCVEKSNDNNRFTWQGKRNNIISQSRIDRIYCSENYINKCKTFTKKWGIGKSDHSAIFAEFMVQPKVRGRSNPRIDRHILENQILVDEIKEELLNWCKNIDNKWNPHIQWEYCKMALRSIIFPIMGREKKKKLNRKNEIISEITSLKNKHGPGITGEENDRIQKECDELSNELDKLINEEIDTIALKSGIKWREEGERSTKYFLGVKKRKEEGGYIDALKDHKGILMSKTEDLLKIVHEFYSKLYNEKATANETITPLPTKHPKLKAMDNKILEEDITLNEIKKTLNTIRETAPGEDGIPYSVYKKYIDILGPYMLKAWRYSLETGSLTPSQNKSCITLIPKKDKDGHRVENWRPISLSNCDIKLITKTMAIRMNKILPKIIHKSQTAYVKDRNIATNIRTLRLAKSIGAKTPEKSIIVSLDVKKAYDSLNHKFLYETLKEYGFSEHYVKIIKTLYSNNEAYVNVNGFQTKSFHIKRGVKQGDALSCGLFIIAMDPLIRALNSNEKIKRTTIAGIETTKCLAYADDITILCKASVESVKAIFTTYQEFTKRSGLTLNAEKTEVFECQKNSIRDNIMVEYLGESITLKTAESITIGGIKIDHNVDREYEHNVQRRIDIMEKQLKHWMCRDLTINGKSIIAKTFGLSQVIYSMQMCEFKEKELKRIESLYYKFLWSKEWSRKYPERIKRACLKNEKIHGGINALDIESMYEALKVKQVVGALETETLKGIQGKLLAEGNNNYKDNLNYFFKNVSTIDHATNICQKFINLTLQKYCEKGYGAQDDEIQSKMLNMGKNLDLESYARYNNYKMLENQMRKLNYNRPTNVTLVEIKEMLESKDTPQYEDRVMENITKLMTHLPQKLREVVEIQTPTTENEFILYCNKKCKNINMATTREITKTIKEFRGKTCNIDFQKKHNLEINPAEVATRITKMYSLIKNPTLRAIRLKVWHNDIYNGCRLKRCNMTESDKCIRCGEIEDTRHQIFDCQEAKRMWSFYNKIMKKLKNSENEIETYEDLIMTRVHDTKQSELLKSVIIKINLQIERRTCETYNISREFKKYISIEMGVKNEKKNGWADLISAIDESLP
jgi:hypothetical protein